MNDTLHDPSWLICHDNDDHDAVHATSISPMTSSSTCGNAIHTLLASSLASSSSSWDIPFLGGGYVVHPSDVNVVLYMTLGLLFQLFVGFIFACVAYVTILPSRHGRRGQSLSSSSGEGGIVDDGAVDGDSHDVVDSRDGGGGRRGRTMMMI